MPIPLALPLIIGSLMQGAGSMMGAHAQSKAMREQQRKQRTIEGKASGMFQNGPGNAEQFLLNLLNGDNFNLESLLGEVAPSYNTGQDALMQMLRANPADGMNPANAVIDAMMPVRKRLLDETVGGMHAGASGLGQRFGSAMMKEESKSRREAAETFGAQDAQLLNQGYESGMNRLLEAIGLSQQNAQGMGQLGLGMLDTQIGAMQGLGGLEQARQAGNINLLSLMAGMPIQGGSPWGQAMGDMGQMAAFLPILLQLAQRGGGTN